MVVHQLGTDLDSCLSRTLMRSMLRVMFEILDDNHKLKPMLRDARNGRANVRCIWSMGFCLRERANMGGVHLHWSPNCFVVNSSRSCTTFEWWNFFHESTIGIHLVDCSRKPEIDRLSLADVHTFCSHSLSSMANAVPCNRRRQYL